MSTTLSRLPRRYYALLLGAVVLVPATQSWSYQGPAQRVGQGLDNAGKNIRRGVEGAVARGEARAFERDLVGRVLHRIQWDKALVGSSIQLEVRADGTSVLRGAVIDDAAKKRAVDLAATTVGVTRVVDEMVVSKDVKVIQTAPGEPTSSPVIIVTPPATVTPGETRVVVPPAETKVIIKP